MLPRTEESTKERPDLERVTSPQVWVEKSKIAAQRTAEGSLFAWTRSSAVTEQAGNDPLGLKLSTASGQHAGRQSQPSKHGESVCELRKVVRDIGVIRTNTLRTRGLEYTVSPSVSVKKDAGN